MSVTAASSAVTVSQSNIRLVIEVECSRCGPIYVGENAALENLDAAVAHTAQTGHVVILNGTVDRRDEE